MPTAELNNAPKSVRDLYWHHFEEARERGKSEADARQYALRMIHLAGWYRRGSKWEQLTGDIRDKVNVREAFKQPNGRYAIFDIDVFYPNAVKGGDAAYTGDDVNRAIGNTNHIINSGGWRPPLIEGHNPLGDMAADSQADGHGFGVNWRNSPRGEGWARCDLVDVEEPYVRRMQDRKLTGLSARMAKDAGKLGLRFGHIALLGGTPPALSRLPTLEVFSATQSSSLNQVCFSAEIADTFSGVPFMEKDHAKKMAECFSALGSAYASYATGEEGADQKLHEALTTHMKPLHSHLQDHKSEFAGFVGDENEEGKDPLSAGAIPGGDYTTTETGIPVGGSAETELAEEPENPLQENKSPSASLSSIDFSDAGALASAYKSITGKVGDLTKKIDKLMTINSALQGKLARNDFHAECDGLRKENYQLPEQTILDEQWENCFSSGNPKKALDSLRKLMRTYPKVESPADFNAGNPIFGMEGAKPVRSNSRKETTDEILDELHQNTGHSFSESDVKIGDAWATAVETAFSR